MRTIIAVLTLSACLHTVAAQVPTPKEFFGYELGERYTAHAHVLSWLREVARTSDRVTMQKYGETYEGRDLVLLFITSPENHARLDALRERMARLADPRTLKDGEDVGALVADLPVFVWLSYNVHGNETSCTTAAMRTLQGLTTPSETSDELLEGSVIIMDPCLNPDGRDRYVNWFNSVMGKRGDPNIQSLEHDEPWPGGRYNHYYFDLNRDWAFMTQVETRQRQVEYVKWNPQVHVDFHEMGLESSYFFFPAENPVNENFPPYTLKWGEIFGRGNAAAFDRNGWSYFTGESYDLFYPGFGDSWPSLHGAIGMTYEQGGHGRSGITVRRRNKSLLTLNDRMQHHHVAGMATIATAVSRRVELLEDFHEFRRTAIEEGRGGEMREFVLVPGSDFERAARLVELLTTQGVEVRRATEGFTARDVVDYQGNQSTERTFPAGAFLVSLAQPTKRLIRTVLEPRTRIKELYFYDVAAWSLPLAFGVEAFWTRQPVAATASPVTTLARPVGGIDEGDVGYGWLLRWDTMASVRAVIRLTSSGVVVKSARKAFTLDGKKWERGTIVVPKGRNAPDVATRIAEVAKACGVRFVPARSGMTEKGIDLGSRNVVELKKPKLALIAGEGMTPTSYGATRHVVEALYDIPYSSFKVDSIGRLDLTDYTAVVFASGRAELDDAAYENLEKFVRKGGVVFAAARSARLFTAKKDKKGFTKISDAAPKEKGGGDEDKDEDEKSKKPAEKKPRTIEEHEEHRRKRSAPGSIFRVQLDPAHPLAFGYGQEVAVFKGGTSTFDPDAGGIPVGRFVDAPPLSGYILPESEKKMRDRGYVMVEEIGRGAVVLVADDPNFRSAWHGLSRLFLNAVLLLPSH